MSRIQNSRDTANARVLHLDDDPDFLALAAEFLRRAGSFEVVSETDPDAALDRVRSGEVDCVLADFDMPDTSGLDLLSEVRDVDPTVPFILFTGKGSEEIAAEAISEGVTDYVQKRGGREQYDVLANRIENAVERARAAARSRETADRLHRTFDRITDSFLSVDTDWQITYVNDRGASFLGEPVDDLLGRDLRSLPPNGAARFHEEYREAMRTQEPVSFEAESLTHPGRWLDLRAYPAADGLSIYWRDVTTIRRRERELTANRNAIRALHGSVMEFQTCDDADEVLDVAIRCARDVVSFDRCLFARHRDGALERAAQSGDLPDTESRLSTDVGVSGRAYRTGESVVVDDTLVADDVHRPCPFRSLLTVPLGAWGVFQAVAERPNAFDDTDRELAELLTMHVRAALSRVASDERLRRERDLLAAFFESSGEPVVRVRLEGDRARIDRINPSFEQVFGLDAAAVRGDALDDHIVPANERDDALRFNARSNAGEPVEAEVRRLTATGPREFLFRSVPFRGDDDVPMAYGIYVDITARKRRERALERYRTIVESTGDPVYTLDDQGYITYVNEAFGSMTGYDTGMLVGEHMGLLVPADGVERSEALIRDLLRDEERTNDTVELDLVRADGTRVRCENHIALLPFDETFQGTAGSIRDITDRQERKRELKAQNERLDEFASVVSHDLRNPLQVAQGHLDLARECVDDDVESLDRVEEALDRIDAIVEDVLTLAREGGDAPDVAETAIEDVARRAWDSVDTDDARLRVETDATVRADAERVQRLFENLFRNAVEHASKRGGSRVVDGDDPDAPPGDTDPTVTVRVGHVADGSGFFVEDDGPGIDPDERDRVFESGYSTTREGTGFGLDIVEAIAASHEWDVVLTDSTLGGARFEFRSVE